MRFGDEVEPSTPCRTSSTVSGSISSVNFGCIRIAHLCHCVLVGIRAHRRGLFAMVQLTMIGWGVARGERLRLRAWMGSALAFAGLFALTWRGRSAPDGLGIALMGLSGVAWGV